MCHPSSVVDGSSCARRRPARAALKDGEGDRRPVGLLGHLAERAWLGGKRERLPGRDVLQALGELGRERAHAEQPATARTWLMAACRKGMVAMMGDAAGFAHAMIDHV